MAQQIFSPANHAGRIAKTVNVRHSFASHLPDKGTDTRYIKDLLDHFNINSTEPYLSVSKKQLRNILRLLDDRWKKERIDW